MLQQRKCARSPACGAGLSHLMVRVSYSSPRERERVVAREDANEMSVRVGGIKTRSPPRCRSPREKKARAQPDVRKLARKRGGGMGSLRRIDRCNLRTNIASRDRRSTAPVMQMSLNASDFNMLTDAYRYRDAATNIPCSDLVEPAPRGHICTPAILSCNR
jgi:hypothetical protein